MRNTEVFFESPAWLALAVPAVLALYAAYRWLRGGEGNRRIERAALTLRTIQVLLIALIIAGLSVVTYSSQTETIVLVDSSYSMEPAAQQAEAMAEEILRRTEGGDTAKILRFAEAPEETGKVLQGSATDIASAIAAACGERNTEGNRRIILLSDGAATHGDLAAAAETAALAGARIDAVYFDTTVKTPEAEVTQLILPADAAQGQRFAARITVAANAQMKGALRIRDGESVIHEEMVSVLPGEHAFSVNLTASGLGEHTYCAEFAAQEDTVAQNNLRYGCMRVNSGARVLLVDGTGEETHRLEQLLKENGSSVDVVASGALPDTVAALCEYGLIVLMNVDAADLPQGSAERLEVYVGEYGRSVLTTGGENTYIYGGMKGTAFETFLPVRMSVEEKESVDPVALMLVIDTTDSMTRQSMGVPIEMARRGAIKCIDGLNANDYAGVITFSDEAEVLVEMTSMQGKDEVIAAINGIGTASPDKLTKFSDALKTACEELKAFDKLERKHVIFITDGSPADAKEGFDRIVRDMRANNITMSTIAVGRIMNVVKLLEELSSIGGGRCYFVEGAQDLPDVMSTDTVLSQVEYTIDEPVIPQIETAVFPIADEHAITQLYGYIRTSAKGSAATALAAPQGRPIYAQWNYGSGIAASFMSDLSGDWSRTWFNSEAGRELIAGMIRGLVPDTLSHAGLDVRLEPRGTQGMLMLTGGPENAQAVHSQVVSPSGKAYDTLLQPDGEGGYAGEIRLDGAGRYALTISYLDAQNETLDTQEASVVYSWPREYEAAARGNTDAVLMELAGQTGGAVARDADELLAIDMGRRPIEHDAALPLTVVLMICLLADIIIRKTKLKHLSALLAVLHHRRG